MTWLDTPETRKAFVSGVEKMVADAGGVDALVALAVEGWVYINDNMHVDPSKLKRKDLEQAYTNAMHAGWHLARLSWAVNGSLLDGGDARRYTAAMGAAAKKAADPKTEAKAGALELWKERHAGLHPRLRTVEQFAIEVMHRWPVLTSAKVICGWSARWTKQSKAGQAPVC